MTATDKPREQRRVRYGIGEWYGSSFACMTPQQRKQQAEVETERGHSHQCPWRSASAVPFKCNKKGGVCSLRIYEQRTDTGAVLPAKAASSGFCTTCPERFYEADTVFQWVGRTILGCGSPVVLSEIGFLERDTNRSPAGEGAEDVGKIDHVLVVPGREPLHWCALEMQAVYFSGASMSRQFQALRSDETTGIPFPDAIRRPDFRSSGPKRLMPQLQIKVPALRRWGKKMAVVIDRAFFDALGPMQDVRDLSNCDIAWFVLRYEETPDGRVSLQPDTVHLTTLEHAVEGLTAGKPVHLEKFEQRIREKLSSAHSF